MSPKPKEYWNRDIWHIDIIIREIVRSTSLPKHMVRALLWLVPIDFTHNFEDYFMGTRAFICVCQWERCNHAGRHICHITKYAYCITAIKQTTLERGRQVGNPSVPLLLCVRIFIMIMLNNKATKRQRHSPPCGYVMVHTTSYVKTCTWPILMHGSIQSPEILLLHLFRVISRNKCMKSRGTTAM